MARKMMSKEVTKTTVKAGKIEMENGIPNVVELPKEIIIGNVSLERAQKELNKKYGEPITIFEVQPDTTTYELSVEKFLEIASVKEPVAQEA